MGDDRLCEESGKIAAALTAGATVPVTVVIVNWNSGDFIAKCLEHLEAQTVRPERILIVDNGSTDRSYDYAERSAIADVHRMNENRGFAAANNWAFAHSDTEFVALLNPDAFPQPEWLEGLYDAAIANPDAAAFGSYQLSHERPEDLDGVGDRYHISGRVWRDRRWPRDDKTPREIFSACAAAAIYRRKVFIDACGFDEDFFCYVEDVDLGFRLRVLGHKTLSVPKAVVHHVGSATTGGRHSDFSIYHGHRNLVWTYVKNMPGLFFWIFLPLHLVLNIITVVHFGLHGRARVILKAKRDAIRGLPLMWRKRQEIQRARLASNARIWQMLDKGWW